MFKAIVDAVAALMTDDAQGRASALEHVFKSAVGDTTQFKKCAAVYIDDIDAQEFRTNRSKTFHVPVVVAVMATNFSDPEQADADLYDLLDDNAGNGILKIFDDRDNATLGDVITRLDVGPISFDNAIGESIYQARAYVRLSCLQTIAYS